MSKKYNKVFIISGGLVPPQRPPAGLAFLAGLCEKNFIDYEVVDVSIDFGSHVTEDIWKSCYASNSGHRKFNDSDLPSVDQYFKILISRIIDSNCDLLAISVLSFVQHPWVLRFLSQLSKDRSFDIIIGGPGVGTKYQNNMSLGYYLANNNLVDFYVLGEGDIVFDQFLKGQQNLKGLNTKLDNEHWVDQLDDLDQLSWPSYAKFNFQPYRRLFSKAAGVTITGSRGCVRRCSFCDVGFFWKKFRYRSGKNLAEEMYHHYQSTGETVFWFSDSLINGSLKQFYQFLDSLYKLQQQDSGFQKISYSGQFIIRPMRDHKEIMFDLMGATGCDNLQIGIESGSDRVRDHIGKKFSNQDIDYHMSMSEKYKIKNAFLLMVGYPTETREDFEQTKQLLIKNQKYLINSTVVMATFDGPTFILPNTPLYTMREELGIENLHTDNAYPDWKSTTNPNLTLHERYRRWAELTHLAVELGYPVHELTEKYIDQYTIAIKSVTDCNAKSSTLIIPIIQS